MPYEFLYDWSEPEYLSDFPNLENFTRRTMIEDKYENNRYVFHLDEYDTDGSHWITLRVVNPKSKDSILIDNTFNSYEELEEALSHIIQFIHNIN